MIKAEYLKQIQAMVSAVLRRKDAQAFLFGSATRKPRFRDCDIGLTGRIDKDEVRRLKEVFEESDLPYKVDVVDFNRVSETFKRNVLARPIIWIKH